MNRRNRSIAAVLVGVLGTGFGYPGTARADEFAQQTRQIKRDNDDILFIEEDNGSDPAALAVELRRLAAGQDERDRIIQERRQSEEPEEHVVTDLAAAVQKDDKSAKPLDDPLGEVAEAAGLFEAAIPEREYFLKFPLRYMHVTSSYGMRFHPTLHYRRSHDGTDLRAPCGTEVLAAQSGLVVSARWDGSGGNAIMIDHGTNAEQNYKTRYLHLSKMLVPDGQWVSAGDLIGLSGMTGGNSTGCHLHFEVLINDQTVNPLTEIPEIPPEPVKAPDGDDSLPPAAMPEGAPPVGEDAARPQAPAPAVTGDEAAKPTNEAVPAPTPDAAAAGDKSPAPERSAEADAPTPAPTDAASPAK